MTRDLLAVAAEEVSPGWIGSLVVAALVVATYFLARSFLKQLRRVDFPEHDAGSSREPADARGDDRPDGADPRRGGAGDR